MPERLPHGSNPLLWKTPPTGWAILAQAAKVVNVIPPSPSKRMYYASCLFLVGEHTSLTSQHTSQRCKPEPNRDSRGECASPPRGKFMRPHATPSGLSRTAVRAANSHGCVETITTIIVLLSDEKKRYLDAHLLLPAYARIGCIRLAGRKESKTDNAMARRRSR